MKLYIAVIPPPGSETFYGDAEFLFTEAHAKALVGMAVYDVFGDPIGYVRSATLEPNCSLCVIYETPYPATLSIEATAETVRSARAMRATRVLT